MSTPEVCVLKTDGVNCDEETMYAFEAAGGSPELVHVNQLRSGERRLKDYGVLALAGGFSYGDDIASGKVLANELTSYLSDQLQEFVEDEKPAIGICNGFQVLTGTGLLPAVELGQQQLTLATNDSGRFECRWVNLTIPASVSRFVKPEDFDVSAVPMQVAHKEGKLVGPPPDITRLAANRQVVFRYSTGRGTPTDTYPYNPNGSMDNIAGITDPSGLILGMMPHPERSVAAFPPDRSQIEIARHASESIFKNIVAYAKEL
ncbi:MAG TPA: phosphoribosylformylglycinamidine synthase I [Candidatus Saccharimonadales bacterium]|nr:phosphoribosylformylglycinamidine synthase I [Candidatus Saccharimonadales bacterium]